MFPKKTKFAGSKMAVTGEDWIIAEYQKKVAEATNTYQLTKLRIAVNTAPIREGARQEIRDLINAKRQEWRERKTET